jgi:hypothetical protein
MRQGPRRAHLTVPELTCESCQGLAQELDRTRGLLRESAVENSKVTERLSASQNTVSVLGLEIHELKGEIRGLKGQLTKQGKKVVTDEQVEKVVQCWREHRPRTPKGSFPEGGKQWKMIQKALKLTAEAEGGAVKACCEAIHGLHLAPYEQYGKRFAKDGPGRTLRRDLEHALGDETRIEKCRQITRDARNLSLSAKARAFEVSGQVADAWARVYLDALEERPDDVVEIDGIRTDVSPKEGSDD